MPIKVIARVLPRVSPATRRPTAASSGCTIIWNAPSCRDEPSTRQPISIISFRRGCSSPSPPQTVPGCAPGGPDRRGSGGDAGAAAGAAGDRVGAHAAAAAGPLCPVRQQLAIEVRYEPTMLPNDGPGPGSSAAGVSAQVPARGRRWGVVISVGRAVRLDQPVSQPSFAALSVEYNLRLGPTGSWQEAAVHVEAQESTPQEAVMNSYSSSPPAPRRRQARQWPGPAQGTLVTAGSPCPTKAVQSHGRTPPVPHRRPTSAPATIRATSRSRTSRRNEHRWSDTCEHPPRAAIGWSRPVGPTPPQPQP
jgi:hypothetical protein